MALLQFIISVELSFLLDQPAIFVLRPLITAKLSISLWSNCLTSLIQFCWRQPRIGWMYADAILCCFTIKRLLYNKCIVHVCFGGERDLQGVGERGRGCDEVLCWRMTFVAKDVDCCSLHITLASYLFTSIVTPLCMSTWIILWEQLIAFACYMQFASHEFNFFVAFDP